MYHLLYNINSYEYIEQQVYVIHHTLDRDDFMNLTVHNLSFCKFF